VLVAIKVSLSGIEQAMVTPIEKCRLVALFEHAAVVVLGPLSRPEQTLFARSAQADTDSTQSYRLNAPGLLVSGHWNTWSVRGRMRRREFITLLGGAAAVRPLGVQAQEAGRSYRLGLLNPLPREMPQFVSFFDELRRFGFVEGQNLIVNGRGFASRPEQFVERAVEIVKSGVNVVVCGGDVAIRAAQQATTTVPLLGISDDMLAQRHVSSLARPDANTTGISILATELDGKRQEILIELVPAARRMAALADSATTAPSHLQALQDAARGRGVELSIHQVARPEEIGPTIEAAHASGVQAINVLATALLNAHRRLIFERTVVLRLPAIYQFPESAEDGGLFGYGPRITDIYRQVARQVVNILRGAKLSDVPVEQPTTFELVINLRTAKALGLEVSTTMLNRADKVIE
jgi:ABC-type uncharacterized transport system substrate-binding protein